MPVCPALSPQAGRREKPCRTPMADITRSTPTPRGAQLDDHAPASPIALLLGQDIYLPSVEAKARIAGDRPATARAANNIGWASLDGGPLDVVPLFSSAPLLGGGTRPSTQRALVAPWGRKRSGFKTPPAAPRCRIRRKVAVVVLPPPSSPLGEPALVARPSDQPRLERENCRGRTCVGDWSCPLGGLVGRSAPRLMGRH